MYFLGACVRRASKALRPRPFSLRLDNDSHGEASLARGP